VNVEVSEHIWRKECAYFTSIFQVQVFFAAEADFGFGFELWQKKMRMTVKECG
jgi:hypothetical protein